MNNNNEDTLGRDGLLPFSNELQDTFLEDPMEEGPIFIIINLRDMECPEIKLEQNIPERTLNELQNLVYLIKMLGGRVRYPPVQEPDTGIPLAFLSNDKDFNRKTVSQWHKIEAQNRRCRDLFNENFIRDITTRKRTGDNPAYDLNNYRIGPSFFETYDANDFVRRRLHWSDLRLQDQPMEIKMEPSPTVSAVRVNGHDTIHSIKPDSNVCNQGNIRPNSSGTNGPSTTTLAADNAPPSTTSSASAAAKPPLSTTTSTAAAAKPPLSTTSSAAAGNPPPKADKSKPEAISSSPQIPALKPTATSKTGFINISELFRDAVPSTSRGHFSSQSATPKKKPERVAPISESDSDVDDVSMPLAPPTKRLRKGVGKGPYKPRKPPITREEQRKMLDFVIANNYFHRVQTKTLYHEMARREVVPDRTHGTLSHNFRRLILGKPEILASFKLPPEIMRKFNKHKDSENKKNPEDDESEEDEDEDD